MHGDVGDVASDVWHRELIAVGPVSRGWSVPIDDPREAVLDLDASDGTALARIVRVELIPPPTLDSETTEALAQALADSLLKGVA